MTTALQPPRRKANKKGKGTDSESENHANHVDLILAGQSAAENNRHNWLGRGRQREEVPQAWIQPFKVGYD